MGLWGVETMPLSLLENTSSPVGFTGGLQIDNLTWWFWVKAGMGFTIGAGFIYLVGAVLWLELLMRAPSLVILRALTRF